MKQISPKISDNFITFNAFLFAIYESRFLFLVDNFYTAMPTLI